MHLEPVRLTTSDGVHLAGLLSTPHPPARQGVLLLHMMPATKESWAAWHAPLNEAGLASFAIDLRGHGESRLQNGQTLDYRTFTDPEHQASRFDVEAALAWLAETLATTRGSLGIIGASIGANLAVAALALQPELPWAVLLSPGLNYRGVTTLPLLHQLHPPTRLLALASTDDPESLATIQALAKARPDLVTTRELSGLGHGTTMTERQPSLIPDIVDWIISDQKTAIRK